MQPRKVSSVSVQPLIDLTKKMDRWTKNMERWTQNMDRWRDRIITIYRKLYEFLGPTQFLVSSEQSGFFSDRLLSVLRGHSVFSSPPQRPMTSDFEGFSIPDFIHYIFFPILILEKEPVFPF